MAVGNIHGSYPRHNAETIEGWTMRANVRERPKTGRERPEKILVAMYMLTNGDARMLSYEDIVVKAFELFPDEFALRGYPHFPDASDIHKPLYGPLRRAGLIRRANKNFGLTPKGIEVGRRLVESMNGKQGVRPEPERLTRPTEAEIERMVETPAFKLYTEGRENSILDTDFYAFLGCTVRTDRYGFLGRLNTVRDAIAIANKLKQPNPETARLLKALLAFLSTRFVDILTRKEGTGKK
jgi:hypothetical protein